MDESSPVVAFAARSDWRLAFTAACIGGLASATFLAIDLHGAGVRQLELVYRLAHPLIFAVVAFVLWNHRDRPTRRFCTIAAVVMWIPFFPSLWLSEETSALAGHLGYSWQPFVGHKVLFFGTAALFPGPAWVGATMLLALGLHAMILWFHLGFGLEVGSGIPVDEPWATIAYLGVAAVLFGYRIYQQRTQANLARARAEAAALRMATDAFLAVHDLANTPLQVLEIAIGLLRRSRVGDDAILDSASHAVARLRALGDQLPVSTVTSASPDPEAIQRLSALALTSAPAVTPSARRRRAGPNCRRSCR